MRTIKYLSGLFLATIAVAFATGCASTADVTRYQNSTCEIHKCAMTIQLVDCLPGFSGYRTEYNAAYLNEFPHHGGTHYSEDHLYLHARHLRTYVCAECTKAHDQWLTDHPNR